MNIIIFILVGAVAGWLAGYLLKKDTSLSLMDIVLGMLGAIVGGYVFSLLGLGVDNLLGEVISATIGAIVIVWLVGLISEESRKIE